MLNRDLLIIRYKQPFVDWVNEADPHSDGPLVTLKSANEDSPAYLIHDCASEHFEEWLELYYTPLFESLLHEWDVDPTLWPQDRSLTLFKNWYDSRLHSLIQDRVDGPLLEDEIERDCFFCHTQPWSQSCVRHPVFSVKRIPHNRFNEPLCLRLMMKSSLTTARRSPSRSETA
jgi:hypothetical protein